MIDPAVKARIRSLYFGEHWRVGTIARELGLHAVTVNNALTDRVGWPRITRPDPTEPYHELIRQVLKDHPRLRATRLFEMLRVRGYAGGVRRVRVAVAALRPAREVFAELRTFPGEQAQVDWAHFGKVAVPGGVRTLSCFVMTLSWSRAIYVEYFFDQSLENFLRGHVRAFSHFGGAPRIALYDNLRSAVLERLGSAVRFNPKLLELCAHYHFQPRPCAVRRGNEKGRVERAIRYVRESFFAARPFTTLADFNRQALGWVRQVADARRWVEDPQHSVASVLDEERPHLLTLPEHPFETDLVLPVTSRTNKTFYVPFDGNRYSFDPAHAGRPLTLAVSDTTVRLLDGAKEVGVHPRCYDRNRRDPITDPAHEESLLAKKRRAVASVPSERLRAAVPEIKELLRKAFDRGESASAQTAQLLKLLDAYGQRQLRRAVCEALQRDTPRASSVAFILQRQKRAGMKSLPLAVDLRRRPELEALNVTPHDPEVYDELASVPKPDSDADSDEE